MSWIAGSSREVTVRDYRRRYTPVVSALVASLAVALPFVVVMPVLPDLAFLVVLAWRLLRPEIWRAHAALGLGLFNDLVTGHPIGQSMAIWTGIFLLCDYADSRLGFRDFWMDWLLAAVAILLHLVTMWYIATMTGSAIHFSALLPQIGLSILLYPVMARIVLGLDRWRLAR